MKNLKHTFDAIAEGKFSDPSSSPEIPVRSFDPERSRKLACGIDPLEPAPKENFTWFNPALHKGRAARMEAQHLVTDFKHWAGGGAMKFLTVLGGVGIGKTDLAKTAVWRLTPKWHNRHSYYITASEFDKRVKDFASVKGQAGAVSVDPDEWVERLAATENLVIDDIGAGYIDRGWTQSRLERLIDLRWRYSLPTVIISNLSRENLKAEVGDRAFSRLEDKSIGVMLELTHLSDIRQLDVKERKA